METRFKNPAVFFPRTVWFILIFVALALVTGCTRSAVTKEPTEALITGEPIDTPVVMGVTVGNAAPEFTLNRVNGEAYHLPRLRGQAVVVYFWSVACKPCQAEMKILQETYIRYQAHGLMVLGINNSDQSLAVEQYASENEITFPLLLDRDNTVTDLYKVRNAPAAYYLDRDGVVRQVRTKAVSADEVDRLALEILSSSATLPTPTGEAMAGPSAPSGGSGGPNTTMEGCITASALNVRTGPGVDNPALSLLREGECQKFDGRSVDSGWLRLDDPSDSGQRRWVSAEYVDLEGEIEALPPIE
jgi:cytochrome c biogenesis protein CcmG, thiol:disulfide interchange protein DsbE